MYKTVIVPLDGSAFAEQAIGTAATIAQRSGAALVLVRVHETYVFEATEYSIDTDLSRLDQEQYLAATAERVEQIYGLAAERTLLEGVVGPSICDFATGLEAPLIVLSTHGRTGFSRFWLGSVADAIMRHASTPVLMLRHRGYVETEFARAHHFRHILVPLDGSTFAEEALEPALALSRAFNAKLTLLRVVAPVNTPAVLYAAPFVAPPTEVDEETLNLHLERAEEYASGAASRMRLAEPDLEVDTVVRVDASPAAAILATTLAHGVDAVALATHGRGLSRLVIASVADKVLRAGPDAVLVLRTQEGRVTNAELRLAVASRAATV